MNIIKTKEELSQFLSKLKPTFSLDTETTDLRYDLLEVEVISLYDGENLGIIVTPYELQLELRQFFSNQGEGKTIIMHNSVFDLKVLNKLCIKLTKCKLYDTMVAAHLLDERQERGLKYLAKTILGKEEVMDYSTAIKFGKESKEFMQYCANDVVWTYELAKWQQTPLKEQGLVKLFREIEMPFQFVLLEMELTGFPVDKEKIIKTAEELRKEIESLTIQMLELLGERFSIQKTLSGETKIISPINFNSSQQLIEIITNRLGLTISDVTDTGAPSVGKDTIKKLKKEHPFIELLQKYKIAQKLLTSFFEPLPSFIQQDGRVRAHFNDCGTRTGRLSCNDPNLQQLPKVNEVLPINTRDCFVAIPNYKIVTCDYSGQELRVLAHVTNCKNMIAAFNSGRDFHSETAAKFNVTRMMAKAINFGIAYRKGAYGFSKDWGTTEEEAQKMLDAYFAQFPEIKNTMESSDKFLNTHGYVVSMTGRRRRFDKVKKDNWVGYLRSSYREAFNFLIQGFSSDMMRIALINIQKNKPKDLYILGTVHDEGIFMVPEDKVEEYSKFIYSTFVNAVTLSVPITSEIGVGNSYGEAK